jgi:hypothetical protein
MKIIGFSQLRNELRKGNLQNWFACMQQCCNYIYIYDQASDDGSKEFYKTQKNTFVIESPINDFTNELKCKQKLMDKIYDEHPDVDWIFWVDGDTLLDERMLKNNGQLLKEICTKATEQNLHAIAMGHYNLWRSDIHYRVDSDYDLLNGKVVALWRNIGKLNFVDESGLHKIQYPININPSLIGQIHLALIHHGFATDYQIITKYNVYKERGQTGGALERLLNEENLTVRRLPYEMLPNCVELENIHIPKKKIRDIYNETK